MFPKFRAWEFLTEEKTDSLNFCTQNFILLPFSNHKKLLNLSFPFGTVTFFFVLFPNKNAVAIIYIFTKQRIDHFYYAMNNMLERRQNQIIFISLFTFFNSKLLFYRTHNLFVGFRFFILPPECIERSSKKNTNTQHLLF